MSQLAVGVIVVERGGLYGRKLLQKQRREILPVGLVRLRRGHHPSDRGRRLGRVLRAGECGREQNHHCRNRYKGRCNGAAEALGHRCRQCIGELPPQESVPTPGSKKSGPIAGATFSKRARWWAMSGKAMQVAVPPAGTVLREMLTRESSEGHCFGLRPL